MKLWKKGCFAALVAISGTCLLAALPPSAFSVDGIFTDHMVLQRRQPVRISGSAQAGVIVSVKIGDNSVRTQTDASGRWLAELPAMESGGPYEVVVHALVDAQNGAFGEIRLEDVMVGEDWVVDCWHGTRICTWLPQPK